MIGEEIALGVVSNIAYGGLTRLVGGIAGTVQRRQAIERSLVNPKDTKATKFKTAIDDFQTVVANSFGANTKRFDDFLNELSRSAFPEVLTETILSGSDDVAAKHIFNSIVQNYKDTPEFKALPSDLFSALQIAVRAQYDLLSAEGGRVGYSELRSTIGRTVISGDPGGGKSTTVQHICFEFARSMALAIEHPDRKGIDASRQRLPIGIWLCASSAGAVDRFRHKRTR